MTRTDGRLPRRRDALRAMIAAGCAVPLAAACAGPAASAPAAAPAGSGAAAPASGRTPSIFLAHGSPFLLDDAGWVADLSAWARALPRPESVLMISAHWEQKPVTLGATTTVPLVYDFYGFPKRCYEVKYPAPGAPRLAARVRELLAPTQRVLEDPERGLDHGAYVPLVAMYPKADVPVLQISLPTMDAPALLELGRALAPLRSERVLIVGSGFLSHNFAASEEMVEGRPPAWATDFDAWCADVLARRDADALVDYRFVAPGVTRALPTHEHFVPVVVAMGAALDARGATRFPVSGFGGGANTRRSVEFA